MLKAHINGRGFIKDFLKTGNNNSGLEFTNTLEDAQVFTLKTQIDYVVASAGIPVVNITFIGEEEEEAYNVSLPEHDVRRVDKLIFKSNGEINANK